MASTLEQLLTCCICLDRFRNPKLLPCQHSVCMEPCMEGLVDYVRRQVKCPECRAEHRIPYNGVQGFPANVTLQRFLEAHIEITGEAPDPFTGQIMERCGVCNEKNYLSMCAHCEKKICSDCKAAHADILKREIGRINNQVKRAVHRLGDQLSIVERNINALKQNSDSVSEDIENINRRLQKAIRDRCESLKTEVLNYYNTEHRHLTLLKEGLEQEISNVESNTDLAEKHMDDQTPWDDNELMDTKDIFLRTMEFIRGFDYESGDYNRRARFNAPDDINKLASNLATLGELVISNPRQTMDGFSTGSSLQSGLMKSKSDHRLAAQFRDQDDPYSYSSSGRSSPTFTRRRFGERPHIAEEPSSYDIQTDLSRRRFRSRFMRHEDDDRSVRFNDEETHPQPKPRPKVIDTEDVSRGPLSGITRMIDSPRVIQRLQEKEGNFKKKKEETPKPVVQSVPKTPLTFGTPRKTTRQLSEDEIDKIKKQNKSEASASGIGTTTTTTTTAKPSLDRLSSLKESERSSRSERTTSGGSRSSNLSPSSSIQEEESSPRRSSRDLGSSRYDYGSGNSSSAAKSSGDTGASGRTYPYSRSSSTSSVGESGKSTGTKSSRTLDTSTVGRTSRSNSTDSNKSGEGPSATKVSTPTSALANDDSKTTTSRFQRAASAANTDTKTTTPATRGTSGASRYQSRFLPRAGTPSAETSKESVNDDEEEEETSDDSYSEESEDTSEEEEEEEEKNTYQSARGILAGRGTRSRDTSNMTTSNAHDSGYGSNSSKYGGASSSSNDSTHSSTHKRPSYYETTKTAKDNEDTDSKYPYASKYLNRRASATTGSSATNADEDKQNFQSRFLNKSKSSAILGPDNDSESHNSTTTGSSRAKFEELKERRQRLARSKSSAGVEEDETPSPTESAPPHRTRFGRDSDSSSTTSATGSGARSSANTTSTTGTEDTPSNQLSSWARYLKNKYGNKTGAHASGGSTITTPTAGSSSGASGLLNKSSTSPSARSIARSRSSHLLGLAKEDSLEEDSKNAHATPTSHPAGTLAPTPFGNLHRTQYLQKQRLLFKIGSRGSEPGNFTWPRGIAIGPDDSIVVADSSNHRVQVFDKDGKYLKDFGSYGNGEGEFDCLAGVAVNRIGQYIIADRYNHRIQIFDPSGMFLRAFGSQGSSDGKFSYPWGVTTDSLGFIYICDKENHRVQVFQSDGTFVGKFGSLGNKVGQLEHPHYIAVSSTNKVIVSDSNNHRIQVYDINGKVLTAFGAEGSEEGQFKFPRGVAVDEQGYIFVADSGNNRIQIFHPDGTFLRAFGCWGNGDGEFKGLEGVGVMSNGNILICDRENHRVQVF